MIVESRCLSIVLSIDKEHVNPDRGSVVGQLSGYFKKHAHSAGSVICPGYRCGMVVAVYVLVGPWACVVMGEKEYPFPGSGIETSHYVYDREDIACVGGHLPFLFPHAVGTVACELREYIPGAFYVGRSARYAWTHCHLAFHIGICAVAVKFDVCLYGPGVFFVVIVRSGCAASYCQNHGGYSEES